jgi:hypothetical protein
MNITFSAARVRRVLAITLAGLMIAGAWRLTPTILQAAAVDAIYFLMTLGPRDAQHVPTTPVQFVAPMGVAFDAAGRLYVSDTELENRPPSNRVQVFKANNTYAYDLVPSVATGPFWYPVGMVVDASGKVVVADGGNDRLIVFGAGTDSVPGAQLAVTGVHGNFDPLDTTSPDRQVGTPPLTPLTLWFPTSVAVRPGTILLPSPANSNPNGRLAVTDNSNHRVVVLDSNLVPIYAFGGHSVGGLDTPPGTLEYPWGIAIDSAGNYYVADSENNRVQVFREVTNAQGVRSAQFVRVFGSSFVPGAAPNTFDFGSDPGDMARPYGLNFDSKGRLLIADPDKHRIMRVDVTANVPLPANPTYCRDVESEQSENHCIITTSDGLRYDAMVLGALGGGGEALFLYPQNVAESPTKGLAVADTDNDVVQLFGSTLFSLNFDGLPTVDPGPRVLRQPFGFSVKVKNDGNLAAQGVVVPTTTAAGQFTPASRSIAIAPGFSQPFDFTFTPDQPGPVSIVVTASGTAAVLAGGELQVGTQTINGGTVPQGIGLSALTTAGGLAGTTTPGVLSGGVGDTFTVTVRLGNTGSTPLTNVLTAMGISNPALVQLVGSAPAVTTLGPIPASVNLVYTYKMVQAGTVTLSPSASANYVDSLGVTQSLSATPAPVTIAITNDVKAPTSTLTLPAVPASGWYRAQIPVTLTAADEAGGSGVASVTYRMVEANPVDTVVTGNNAQFTVIRQGITTIRYSAKDNAGNTEVVRTVQVKMDSAAPEMGTPKVTTFTGTPQESQAVPPSGWYRTDPTITFIAGDTSGGSNLASLTAPIKITTNGANQSRIGVAVDNAGNISTEASATVSLDKIAPTIVCGALSEPTGLNDWYKSSGVTIKCIAVDQLLPKLLSGIAAVRAVCPAASGGIVTTTPALTGTTLKYGPLTAMSSCTITKEGTHTVYGEATDVAGNLSVTQAITIKIDRTAPVMACSVSASPIVWPRDEDKMVAWKPVVTVTDAVSASSFKLVAYYSNQNDEDDDNHGDDNDHRHGDDDHHDWDDDRDMTGWSLYTADTSGYVQADRGSKKNPRV